MSKYTVPQCVAKILSDVDVEGKSLSLQDWYDTLEMVIEGLAERLQNAGEDLRGKG